jgi:Rne/Rng family ribonuclease
MSKELFVSSTPHETKVAVMEDDQLAEIYFERENEYTLAGSIYKGRVTRVLPGMQSAFVDVGLERDAFLYVTDFLEEQDEDEEVETEPVPRPPRERFEPRQAEPPSASAPEGALVIEGGSEDFAEDADDTGSGSDFAASEQEQQQSEGSRSEQSAEGARPWRGRRRRGGRRRGNEPAASEGPREPQSAEPAPAMERYGPPAGYQPMILPGESIAKFNRPAEPTASEAPSAADGSEEGTSSQTSSVPPSPAPAERERPNEGERGGRDRGGRYQQRGGRRNDRRPRYDDSRRTPQWEPPAGYQPIVLPGESIAKYRGMETAGAPPGVPAEVVEEEHEEHEYAQSGEAEQQIAADAPLVEAAEDLAEEGESATEEFAPAPQAAAAGEEPRSQQEEVFEADKTLEKPAAARQEAQARQEEAQQQGSWQSPGATSASAEPSAPPAAEHTEQKRDRWFRKLGSMFSRHENSAEVRPQERAQAPAEFEAEPHAEHGAPGGEISSLGESRHQQAHPSFSPGEGHLEEEEIEEEESDYSAVGDELEEDEFEELEEHIMDRVAAEAGEVAAGELTEAVEETEVEERAEEAEESSGNGESGGNGRAEVRARSATAGYQQRAQRTGFDRRPGRFRRGGRFMGRRREAPRPNLQIAELLKEGQEILVQIAKEPIGKKGARITSHIALPGRFLVYMPTVNHIGVSRKISSEEERQRLKRIVLSERENGHGGFIVRTAADRADENELRADIRFLKNLWHEIRERGEKSKPPALIYHDLNLVERTLRDQVNQNFSSIWVDTESEYERVVRFVGRFQPSLSRRVKLYTKETPLFEQFGVQEEINKALKSKVWLKSGGYIVINQTEALVAIDVNTGKYVGKTARLEDTIVKTNVDAIREIVRQIRLRDLGGIIVIDFIDMDERKNRHRVMQALEEALKGDRAPSKVLQFNDFGLVAITRKRVKQSLERTLGAPCQYCTGTGLVKSTTTVCNEVWVEMRKMARHFERPDIMLRVHPEVAKALKANNGRWIQDIEELTGKNLIVKSDATVHPEQFDIT